jgi:hypothetical protein
MAAKQKLELMWVGKENRPRLEPRILLEDSSLSYHAPHVVTENDIFDNRLTAYAARCEGKPWKYVLIPHDAIAENMTLEGLARAYL